MRLGHPLAFAGFLRGIGAPVDSGFRRAGLPLLCDRLDAYVPIRQAWSFFDDMSRREVEALGWEVGKWAQDKNVHKGLLKRLALTPTLHVALKAFKAHVTAENSHIRLGIIDSAEEVVFWVRNAFGPDTPGYHHSQAYALNAMLAVVRHFAGRSWLPREIGIQAPKVPARARELFPSTRIRAAQKVGFLRLPQTILALPPDSGWADRIAPAQGEALRLTEELNFTESLRLVLEAYLGDGYTSADRAAALVDTSTRTLQRRLANEGLSYSKLVEQVRYDLARRLLADAGTKIVDVAAMTGYSDPCHFARAFRRVAGVSPREYQRQNHLP